MRSRTQPSVFDKLTSREREALDLAQSKMQVVRLAHKTQISYLARIAHYMVFIRERGLLSISRKDRIEAWLSDFARRRRSASTQNVGFNAIKWFFEHVYEIDMGEIDAMRAKVSQRVRVPPVREDTLRMLGEVRNTPTIHYRTMAFLIYGVDLSEGMAV